MINLFSIFKQCLEGNQKLNTLNLEKVRLELEKENLLRTSSTYNEEVYVMKNDLFFSIKTGKPQTRFEKYNELCLQIEDVQKRINAL